MFVSINNKKQYVYISNRYIEKVIKFHFLETEYKNTMYLNINHEIYIYL